MFNPFRKKTYFLNEFIQVTTKTKISANYTGVNNEPMSASTSLTLQGYLLNSDEHNYYLGDTPKEVSFWIQKNDVLLVEKLSEKKTYKPEESFTPIDKFFKGGSVSKLSN